MDNRGWNRRQALIGLAALACARPAGRTQEEPHMQPTTSASLPTIFVSHGAPNLLLHTSLARSFLSDLGASLPRPRAVLCISAHWTTRAPAVDIASAPRTIHDFSGFEPELYELRYPARGEAEFARDVAERLDAVGLASGRVERGLDHGAWVPLSLMYPAADVPVVQLALQPALGAKHALALGRALVGLRHEGVLVLGSGGATHNLGALGRGEQPPAWARAFDEWLVERTAEGDVQALEDYRRIAPQAEFNHPTEEHLLPLHVALAAAGTDARGVPLHRSFQYSSLSMTALRFG